MKFIDKMTSAVKTASNDVTDVAAKVVHHPNTKAVATWTKEAATEVANQATEQAKDLSKSKTTKDALTGAAIGAAIAVPIPLVGPIFGGLVGAGIGTLIGLRRKWDAQPKTPAEPLPRLDLHKEMTALEDLRQKGILSQEEFDEQKKKLLRKT